MASDTPGFDPRFDPAFQPGFDEGSDGSSRPQRDVPSLGSPPPDSPLRAERPAGVHDQRALDGSRELPGSATPSPPSLRGNPWVRVLWIVAAVFTVGGVAGQAWAQMSQSARPSALTAFVIPALVAAVSPWFILAGLGAAVGVALLYAVRWRPPR